MIAAYYLLMFMTVGVSLPFLPGYFKTLGFTGLESGALLSVGPMFSLVMPPLWGQLADRTRRPGLILTLTTAGGAFGYFLLARASTFEQAFLALCVNAAFASSLTSLADSIAMHHVHRHGGAYSAIRIWGSIGFVLTALPFGFLVTQVDRSAVVIPLALMSTAAIWAGAALSRITIQSPEGPRPTVANALALLKRREVAFFLAATALHWIACAPYHGSLAPHVKDLGLPTWVVGVSASFGVASEIVVMFTWPRWAERVPPRRLMVWVFVASALRWAIMAFVTHPLLLSAVALLHGLTFGAFYLAAVGWMTKHAPGSLRATGQALFAATTFGIGGVIGYRLAGALYDQLGGPKLFLVASLLALLPLVPLMLSQTSHEVQVEAPRQ